MSILPKKKDKSPPSERTRLRNNGYNQALDDVRKAIRKSEGEIKDIVAKWEKKSQEDKVWHFSALAKSIISLLIGEE